MTPFDKLTFYLGRGVISKRISKPQSISIYNFHFRCERNLPSEGNMIKILQKYLICFKTTLFYIVLKSEDHLSSTQFIHIMPTHTIITSRCFILQRK